MGKVGRCPLWKSPVRVWYRPPDRKGRILSNFPKDLSNCRNFRPPGPVFWILMAGDVLLPHHGPVEDRWSPRWAPRHPLIQETRGEETGEGGVLLCVKLFPRRFELITHAWASVRTPREKEAFSALCRQRSTAAIGDAPIHRFSHTYIAGILHPVCERWFGCTIRDRVDSTPIRPSSPDVATWWVAGLGRTAVTGGPITCLPSSPLSSSSERGQQLPPSPHLT